uniref:Nucleocapsid n=1 Tax=La Piedad-Michoacan-Mexico virus TaxID=3052562 RepID=A0A1P8D8C0_LPMV|nr:nucleocapsid [Orthorubulavirus suis]APU52788.1 nucleocapsid [Orthorubulavirus suis]
MSSVLTAFERFTIEQELQDRGAEGSIPPETLKTRIQVFILNDEDPHLRWRMFNLCLRLILSPATRTARKIGAMITLFSLPAAAMQNHVRLADRSPDAIIERVEINGFVDGTWRLIPNDRAILPDATINALNVAADELPPDLVNRTPYVVQGGEDLPCDEVEIFLQRAYSVLIQAWIMVCKCMTAYDQPAPSEERRIAKYRQQGRLEARFILQNPARRGIQKVIRESLVVRQYLAYELQIARNQSLVTNKYYAIVGDIGKYIENAGLSAFFLTVKFALGTKWQPLALSAFSGELTKLKSLMLLYRDLGEQARYLALLEAPQAMDFAPANYPLIYSYAMGVGTVLDPQMRNYNFARPFLNAMYFQFGVETARRQQGAVDTKMAEELGLTAQDKQEMTETLNRLGAAGARGAAPAAPNPFNAAPPAPAPIPVARPAQDGPHDNAAAAPAPAPGADAPGPAGLHIPGPGEPGFEPQEYYRQPGMMDMVKNRLRIASGGAPGVLPHELDAAAQIYVDEVVTGLRRPNDFAGILEAMFQQLAEEQKGDLED